MRGSISSFIILCMMVMHGTKFVFTYDEFAFNQYEDSSLCEYYTSITSRRQISNNKSRMIFDYKSFESNNFAIDSNPLLSPQVVRYPCQAVLIALNPINSFLRGIPHLNDDIDSLLQKALDFFDAAMDGNRTIRQLTIVYNRSTSSVDGHAKLGNVIDKFLAPRLWWRLSGELSYNHPHRLSDVMNDTSQLSAEFASLSATNFLVLYRYPHWESYIRFLANIQYPMDCGKYAMMLNRAAFIHPGWWSVIDNTQKIQWDFPYAIYTQYFPHYENPSMQRNAFIKFKDCQSPINNLTNKWECAFLPMTNCTIPRVVEDCVTKECVREQFNYNYDSTLLTNATQNGSIVQTEHNNRHVSKRDEYWYKYGGIASEKHPFTVLGKKEASEFYYRAPYDASMPAPNKRGNAMRQLFCYILTLRPNAFYRAKVNSLIRAVRHRSRSQQQQATAQLATSPNASTPASASAPASSSSSYFSPTTSCIAAHVRRGDRVKYNRKTGQAINMTQYCYNVTHSNVCMTEAGSLYPCPAEGSGLADLGCTPQGTPFAAIGVLDIVQKAELLVGPSVRHLVIATDDPRWLQGEVEAIQAAGSAPGWYFHYVKAPSMYPQEQQKQQQQRRRRRRRRLSTAQEDEYHFIRSEAGTDSGVYLQAQLQLAMQCEGLIAHFGSGIAYLLYQLMCFQHGALGPTTGRDAVFGVCPPMYDWRIDRSKWSNMRRG